jgi:L-fucose isomerase-like protein
MEKVTLGFIPAHRVPFNEDWAVEMRKRTLEALAGVEEIEVVVPGPELTQNGLVRDDAEAEKVIGLFEEQGVEGLLLGAMTFGDEISAVSIVENMDLPSLLFGTKEGAFTADGGRRSDAFCGTLSISSGLYRRKIPFAFSGICFPEEEEFLGDVRRFAGTVSAIQAFMGAKIGLVGPRPERFETCAFNEYPMIEQFGQRVVQTSLVDVFGAARALKDDDPVVLQIVEEIRARADCSAASDEAIRKMAKLEQVLLEFAEEKALSGMGIQCWTAMQSDYGISSCTTMGRLTEQGIMAACEVDIHGVLSMLAQYRATLGRTVPHFIDWTIRHQENENAFLAWHCGNAPQCLASENSKPHLRSHSILGEMLGHECSQGCAEFQLQAGTVTFNRLVEYDGEFKMLITKGEIVPSDQQLRGSWSWVEVPSLEILYRTLVEEGFTHHASMIHGDVTGELLDFCMFLGIEAVMV